VTLSIATWNINGVRARLDTFMTWLRQASPDIVCLQEIKTVDAGFPSEPVEALGYNVALHGQKGFNGVAVLSKLPLEDVSRGLPLGEDEVDEQSRFLEAVVSVQGGVLRIASLYLPNGNPIGTDKFAYKLAFMERLRRWAEERLKFEEPLLIAGDFNVIPHPIDAKNPQVWSHDALFQPESRAAFAALEHLGLTDALRASTDAGGIYTFWDYQAGAWQKDHGIRIDHVLLSPEAADRLEGATVEKHVRGWEKPSDHVPVIVRLGLET